MGYPLAHEWLRLDVRSPISWAAKGLTSALGAIDVREFTDVDVQTGAT